MDYLIIIIGFIIFYNLLKIIFNAVRIICFKKNVKKFLEMDLIVGIISVFSWLNSMGTLFYMIPNQVIHSICYFTVISIFFTKKANKKSNNRFLFVMIMIDAIIVLIILNLFKFYFIIFIWITIFIFGVIILRKNKDKMADYGYLMLSLLDIANIILSYIILIVSVATIF